MPVPTTLSELLVYLAVAAAGYVLRRFQEPSQPKPAPAPAPGPSDTPLLDWLRRLLDQQRQQQEARQLFSALLDRDPKDPGRA